MQTWEETCHNDVAILATQSVICLESPDDEAEVACRALGAALTIVPLMAPYDSHQLKMRPQVNSVQKKLPY